MAYKTEQLIIAARLYYYEQLTHSEIAERMNLSRVAVTRMLKTALDKGLVRIVIEDIPVDLSELNSRLCEKYDLEKVIITERHKYSQQENFKEMCAAAAEYISGALVPGNILGLGWGRCVFETVNQLRKGGKKESEIIPIIGGLDEKDDFYDLNHIVSLAAEKLGCKHSKLFIPAIVDSYDLREAMKTVSQISNLCAKWDRMDIAVVGIGALSTKLPLNVSNFLKEHTLDYDDLKIVADVCCNYLDKNGMSIETILKDSLIGANLRQLEKTPKTVAIACGQEKVNAILACLNNGFINVLVTDSQTALSLADRE